MHVEFSYPANESLIANILSILMILGILERLITSDLVSGPCLISTKDLLKLHNWNLPTNAPESDIINLGGGDLAVTCFANAIATSM